MVKLKEDWQYHLLKALHLKGFKWYAVRENGVEDVHSVFPYRDKELKWWDADRGRCNAILTPMQLTLSTWEDEPIEIATLLEDYENEYLKGNNIGLKKEME